MTKTSIRTFLLINLLLSVTLITSLAIVTNLFLEHKDLQKHMDDKLTRAGFTIGAFLTQRLLDTEINTIQQSINNIPIMQTHLFGTRDNKPFDKSYENVFFQIFDNQSRLILQSDSNVSLPPLNFKAPDGLIDEWFKGEPWRVFHTTDIKTGYRIAVLEKYDFKNVLEGHITQDSILIMLIMYPFLGMLIWIIVGRGLSSLKKVANELHEREPGHLEAVSIDYVPIEIRPLVDELNNLFARLRQAFEREKRFAADAAHELRTPLAALKAHTQVALNANTESERKEALLKILAGVDRSTHVVQQLLTLSRMVPESNLETSDVNLVHVAQEVIADLVPEAIERNTEIELIAPERQIIIEGNATALSILIRNLVDNAIRYSPPNSTIQVQIEDNEHVHLCVIDNGPGIPENLRERVFARFYRVLGTKSTGSGLGLGIVQQIVELHHATIKLDTPESGQGLKVVIIF
jgi:two-component system sensor histidine kinase QseC